MLHSQNAAFHRSRFVYGSRERFSLLLLEPGETFFKDYLVDYKAVPTRKDGCGDVPSSREFEWKSGKLRVCSKSIVFEPPVNDLSPLIKVLYREMKEMPMNETLEENGEVSYRWNIVSRRHTLMLENGTVKPFENQLEEYDHEFVLLFKNSEYTLSKQLSKLWQASAASNKFTIYDQDHMRDSIVSSALAMINFDKKWISVEENVLMEVNCKSIGPLTARPGLIVLTDLNLFFVPINDASEMQTFELSSIKRALRRRYALQSTAVEIYCQEKSLVSDLYLAFVDQETRELFINKLSSEKKHICDKNLGELASVTDKWRKRQISNFDYIFYLNLAADRSINDIHQYPVFPWVLSDYTSSSLDLSDEKVYRDFSKPVGALNPIRLASLRERYDQMCEPKFLYGTHYSTPAFVLYYLVRLVPECVLCLQNGQLDQPDRTFHSVPELWNNVNNCPHDFKELIPEFFDGDGEFLMNSRKLDFGVRDDGARIDHVILPPWAQGSARKFIEMNRAALESEYVSEHLHEWIDLIFGYKQKGALADQFDNLFHPLTYEGGYEKSIQENDHEGGTEIALKTQVLEFGQCPVQLFKNEHPPRNQETLSRVGGGKNLKSNNFLPSPPRRVVSASDISSMSNFTSLTNPNFAAVASTLPAGGQLSPITVSTLDTSMNNNNERHKFSSSVNIEGGTPTANSWGRSSIFSNAWRKWARASTNSPDGNPVSPNVNSPQHHHVSSEALKSSTPSPSPNSPESISKYDEDDRLQPIHSVGELHQQHSVLLGRKKQVAVRSMDVNWTGEHIAMALQDGRLCILTVPTETKPIYIRISKMPLTCCKFLNKKNKIILATDDGYIHVVSRKLCKIISTFEAFTHLGSISHISVSHKNSLVAVAFSQHNNVVKLLSFRDEGGSAKSVYLEERSELEESFSSPITYMSLDDCPYSTDDLEDCHMSPPSSPLPAARKSSGGGGRDLAAMFVDAVGLLEDDSRPSVGANSLLVIGTESGDVLIVDALVNAVDHQLLLEFNDAIVSARVNSTETLLVTCSVSQIKLLNISQKPYLPVMQSDRMLTPITCALCLNVDQIIYVHDQGSSLQKMDCLSGLLVNKKFHGKSCGVVSISKNNRFLALLSHQQEDVKLLLWRALSS